MSQAPRLAGGCLCGAVRFTAVPERTDYEVCHCSMCRRWTAGPFMALACGDSLEFTSWADVAVYRSSEWAERGFCAKCGTTLFYKFLGKGHYFVSTEAFDDASGFRLAGEIFYDEKPAHYAFANDTKKMTGTEAMAAFAPSQGGGE